MSKPKKKLVVRPASAKAKLRKLRNEWQQWLRDGLKPRAPITRAELQRRIDIVNEVLAER